VRINLTGELYKQEEIVKILIVILLGLLSTSCVSSLSESVPGIQQNSDPVLVGAGDIASCLSGGDQATADLIEGIEGTVFTTGDNAYPNGSWLEYAVCYGPTWGGFKDRTFPAAGNHDYHTKNAAGYFRYFGQRAGDPAKGYYSYDVGTWHIVVLNNYVPVNTGSDQEKWLRDDLAAHPAVCTAAYWHTPLFSSGVTHGGDLEVRPLWQALYDYGVDVVLNGNEHNYERFAPQDPQGRLDPSRGIRQFVVGTGGRGNLYRFGTPVPNSEVRNSDTYGVLKLTLHPASYSWEFIPVEGKSFTDSGTGVCVKSPPPLDN
jgi:hypothetical protein